MHIVQVVIDGFKSYSAHTVVGPFDPQFNAITGLNGTGKSNILDSICFVMGITNLKQVRATNLSELVYKQGQAGITKATVEITFDNTDKRQCPLKYEDCDKIVVARQVVIGGRNRYIINGRNVQREAVVTLFHSVKLNVNNPHFLIMQGRINKVVNMKPDEILALMEEAAGTKLYDLKRAQAEKKISNKEARAAEIERTLREEFTPRLEQLQKESENYDRWAKASAEIGRLGRFVVAWEFYEMTSQQRDYEGRIGEMQGMLRDKQEEVLERDNDIEETREEIEECKKKKARIDQQQEGEFARVNEQAKEANRSVVKAQVMVENKENDIKAEEERLKGVEKQLVEKRKELEEAQKCYDREEVKQQKMMRELEGCEATLERCHERLNGISNGIGDVGAGGGEQSVNEQFIQAKYDYERAIEDLKICKEDIVSKRRRRDEIKGSGEKKDWSRMMKEKEALEKRIEEMNEKKAATGYDRDKFRDLRNELGRLEARLERLIEDKQRLYSEVRNRVEFQYDSPGGFDRSRVKGVCAKLFDVKPEYAEYAKALEVAAGSRLYHICVDDPQTAKVLMSDPGSRQMRRRQNFVPLSKIQTRVPTPQQLAGARSAAASVEGECIPALEAVDCPECYTKVVEYLFGATFLCDTSDTGKAVTFHPQVRAKSVTRDGDSYDPSGSLTGGSSSGGNEYSVLRTLCEHFSRCKEERQLNGEIEQLNVEISRHQKSKGAWDNLDREHRDLDTQLGSVSCRIRSHPYHALHQEIEELNAQIEEHEKSIGELEVEKERLAADVDRLQEEVASLGGNQEEQIRKLKDEIERVKTEENRLRSQQEAQAAKVGDMEMEKESIERDVEALEASMSGQTLEEMREELGGLQTAHNRSKEKHQAIEDKLAGMNQSRQAIQDDIDALENKLVDLKEAKATAESEVKKQTKGLSELQGALNATRSRLEKLEGDRPWISREKSEFGVAGSEWDFDASELDLRQSQRQLAQYEKDQKEAGRDLNKKAGMQYEQSKVAAQKLLADKETTLAEKLEIERFRDSLDDRKSEELTRTVHQVNKWFGGIFRSLLPNVNAKLSPPQGMTQLEGLELKVQLGSVWKESLSELSGGQKSLLALSLVLALLKFNPAPMYILDEVDAALDVSHTTNIGRMIKEYFPQAQFIIVSLKDGMFNNANVLFRTRFVDGTSAVSRTELRGSSVAASRSPGVAAGSQNARGRKRRAADALQETEN
ncbi:Structural maintenance of chromosomes protein 2 [Perkinsus olseni]|uniref:Structural maintenance of chromosomes protein n=1 Tax=Perkinsus olseni TaxID=32597 RepID=A0A7J6MEE7_PEROL|nr:Structural maintenance of chromosomes protein 2 [Perkinsus olseni]KAF4674830.1 Structural maintenance of chromosomes protein 2 [Perkinsus olseni]